MFYDELFELSKRNAKQVLWVMSDLQQATYDKAKACFDITINDYMTLYTHANMVLCLGDAVQWNDLGELNRMTELQEKAFEKLQTPIVYTLGNHDFDYSQHLHQNGVNQVVMPFWEMIKKHPDWHVSSKPSDPYFKVELNEDYIIYCFQDHIDDEGKWCVSHNGSLFRWGKENYPYDDEYFHHIREEMENDPHKYIITCGHCAFPGGNRDTYLLSKIQPVPLNTRIHFYGHSHYGDYAWGREKVFSNISFLDWQDVPQIDVASMENVRGCYCTSVIAHIYDDGSMGLFFRNHDEHHFTQAFFTKNCSSEKSGDFQVMKEKYASKK